MQRPLIITIGIVIILFILGLWAYLLLFGAPKGASEVFTNLGVIPKTEESVKVVEPIASTTAEVQLSLTGAELQQLTTRAVAGYSFMSGDDTLLRYAERGTGHVYQIDLVRGIETQVSPTTIPQIVDAVFSKNAAAVAFTSFEGYEKVISVAILPHDDQGETVVIKLPQGADNIAFKDDRTALFSITEGNKTKGYSYDLDKLTQREVFTADIGDAEVLWGENYSRIYIETKPTQYLQGYLYTISNNLLTPIVEGKKGLRSYIDDVNVLISYVTNNKYITSWIHDGTEIRQGMIMLKEKCAFNPRKENSVWCAAPLGVQSASYLENWYKGTLTSKDSLWLVDIGTQSSVLTADLSTLAGRTLDVTGITLNQGGSLLIFNNKIDQTLWLYRADKHAE